MITYDTLQCLARRRTLSSCWYASLSCEPLAFIPRRASLMLCNTVFHSVPRGFLSRCSASCARVIQLSNHVWLKRDRQLVKPSRGHLCTGHDNWSEVTPRHTTCMLVEANSAEQSPGDNPALDHIRFDLELLLASLVTSPGVFKQVWHEVSTVTTWPCVVVRRRRCHCCCGWPLYVRHRRKSPGVLVRLSRDNG